MDNWEPPKRVWPKATADNATEAAMSDNGEIAYRMLKPYEDRFSSGEIQQLHADWRAALDAAERRGLERAAVLMSSRATDLRNDDRTRRFCAWAADAIRALEVKP